MYVLPITDDKTRRAAVGWLTLGLAALIASGVFALLLVLSRTPGIQDIIPWLDFFKTALVVHVDLSVLIWFVAFSGVLWTIGSAPRWFGGRHIALFFAVCGTIVITLAPFMGAGDPLMNNYIPVLQHPLFFIGLGLFGIGILVQVGITLYIGFPPRNEPAETTALKTGGYTAAFAATMALLALLWTY